MFNSSFRSKCSKIIQRNLLRMISSPNKTGHLQETANSAKQEMLTSATVVKICDESRTVKGLDLKISDPNFTFKAGQWVDTHISGLEKKVGGFSMCSSPILLQRERILQLAVKNSSHPPADWVHNKCSVGDNVDLLVSGDYCYDPQPGDPPHNLLLVAGGVGINPLMSMLNQIHDLHRTDKTSSACPRKVVLLFSAKTLDEILFKERIEELSKIKEDSISSKFFITEEQLETSDQICRGRISEEHIKESVEELQNEKLLCYLCGPSPMVYSIETMLQKYGVDKSNIHYEEWW